MDIASVLTDILVVLVAAKVAAEVAERIGVPAVVGEIVAGIIIGPSVLHLVGGSDEVLRTLGEIGVILLLLEVGLEMDLAELGKVGRASLLVATVGVVCPFVLGLGAMQLSGDDFKTSLFVAAALTATSVGITARVFGDLHALATTEARIVLGAAVADDVMGLVVLTVVVRLVTEGSVSVLSVAWIVVVAVAFLVVGGLVGLRISGPLFGLVERVSRSTGTMVALALAFALAYARLADAAQLAPIVGAFVAGIALTRSSQAERIRRELAPVGHLFIPVFFLQIGIDAQIDSFVRVSVLRDAALLLVVAVVGKMVSSIGAVGSPGDRLLIGLGMLPRGEVGLIFATIGLQSRVLSEDLYAALLLVVLATTLLTPQLLRLRYTAIRGRRAAPVFGDVEPPDGWLKVVDGAVVLQATPPAHLGLQLGLDAAAKVAHARPTPALLDWLSSLSDVQSKWDPSATDTFLELLTRGNARSWRFLDSLGILERAMPELAQALAERKADPFELDPSLTHRWTTIERLHTLEDETLLDGARPLMHREWLLLAALLHDAVGDRSDKVAISRRVVQRLDLGAAAEQEIALVVGDVHLLWSAAHAADGLSEESVLALASHLGSAEVARALFMLSIAAHPDADHAEYQRLRELDDLIQRVLSQPALTGLATRNLLGQRTAQALRQLEGNTHAIRRVERAPRAYLLRQSPDAIARQAALIDPLPTRHQVRVLATPEQDCWVVDVVGRDRPGFLATVTKVLAAHDLDVDNAVVATWSDRAALESFQVRAEVEPDPVSIARQVEAGITADLSSPPIPEANVSFDNSLSPWHTICEVRAPDKPGLLHALASALAGAAVSVHSARITTDNGVASDRFELTDPNGRKLDAAQCDLVVALIRGGSLMRKRRLPVGFGRGKVRVVDPSLVASPEL